MPMVQTGIVQTPKDRLAFGHVKSAVRYRHGKGVGARAHLLAAGAVARHGEQGRRADLEPQLAAPATARPRSLPVAHRDVPFLAGGLWSESLRRPVSDELPWPCRPRNVALDLRG